MAKIEIYTKATCPFCLRAKALLTAKGAGFDEIAIDAHPEKRDEMIARSGRTTVPQIFIGKTHVGGSDELHALEKAGKLDALLAD